jgi:hypothetical protein
MANWTLQ